MVLPVMRLSVSRWLMEMPTRLPSIVFCSARPYLTPQQKKMPMSFPSSRQWRMVVRCEPLPAGDIASRLGGFADVEAMEASGATDAEIIELGMVTGQFIGFGRLIAALDLENPRQPEA